MDLFSLDKKENSIEASKPVLRKKIVRPPVPAESRLSKISIKSSTPPKCENQQRKSFEVNIDTSKYFDNGSNYCYFLIDIKFR